MKHSGREYNDFGVFRKLRIFTYQVDAILFRLQTLNGLKKGHDSGLLTPHTVDIDLLVLFLDQDSEGLKDDEVGQCLA